MKSVVVGVCAAACLSGCMMEPYHNENIPSKSSPVVVQGWALSGGATVYAQCRPYLSSGAWTPITTFTSLSSSFVLNGSNLYPVTGSMTIPAGCWFQWHPSQASAELSFYQPLNGGSSTYRMFDQTGRKCVFDAVGKGKDPINSALDCKPLDSVIVSAP